MAPRPFRSVRKPGSASSIGLRHARGLPPSELTDGGRPPFLIVVDVGNTIELHSEFTRSGGNYVPFPDPHSYRFPIEQLRDEATRAKLRKNNDPAALHAVLTSSRSTQAA